MYELAQNEYGRVQLLLQAIPYDRAPVFSVIEGNNPGRVFVDRPSNPQTALVCTAGLEFYLAGSAAHDALNREMVQFILADLAPSRTNGHLFFYCFSAAWERALDELLKDQGVIRVLVHKLELSRERFEARHRDWRRRIPEGFHVQPMDHRLAAKVGGMDELWGSLDNFISHAFGFYTMKGDEPISHCCPVYLGDRRFETGVGTEEKYRRQGLAMLACCAFIERCLDEGFFPEWSCFYNNEASRALALKLGFVSKPDVHIHYVNFKK